MEASQGGRLLSDNVGFATSRNTGRMIARKCLRRIAERDGIRARNAKEKATRRATARIMATERQERVRKAKAHRAGT